jgi:hypothetical protein
VVPQQPLEDIDVPVADDIPVVGHGTVLVPVGTTGDWVVISGNGLSPPTVSSVDPIGIPTRPTAEREASVGEEADAVGLDNAAALAQVPDAVPAMPAPSNSAVGADVPMTAPVAGDSPLIALPVPTVELPNPDVAVCIDPSAPEHVVADMVEPRSTPLETDGLTPGVANSVAPSGIPVGATGAPAPMPSGDVMPMGAAMPVPTALWANAAGSPVVDRTSTSIARRLIGASTPALVDGATNGDRCSTGWLPSEPPHQNGLARARVRLKKDLLCEHRPTRFAATRFSFAGRCGSLITRRCHLTPPSDHALCRPDHGRGALRDTAGFLKSFGYEAEVLCSAPEATMEFCVNFLLRFDEGQQRTIGRRGRDANGVSAVDTGTADRLFRGGKIRCRKHEAGTAALG